jgi:cytidylate kinase
VTEVLVVAIDGPSGSGKSTVARALAERLGVDYLDTGAMYRAVAFAALQRSIDPDDPAGLADLVGRLEISVADGVCTVDGVDASVEIRGPEVTRAVSAVAAIPEVRADLVSRQRAWIRERGGGVGEGRDIGSVVWPDARLKVYLTANLAVRAERRAKEVAELAYEQVAADITRRDILDASRDADPLQQAAGSVVVDTTDRSVDEIVEDLLGRV